MAKYDLIHFEVEGHDIPVKRYYEIRKNVRVSIGKDSILLRIPSFMNRDQRHSYHKWAKEWLTTQINDSRGAIAHLIPTKFLTGDEINCMGDKYILNLEFNQRTTNTAKIKASTIRLKLNSELQGLNRSEVIKTLLSRVLAKKYKPIIEERLRLINKHYFGHVVNSVRLKYNRTNWGSCSNSKNINLSTRLLMAPQWVIDYVIVHELSHINEMNHSKKFWSIVEGVYPGFRKAERWLKLHGSKCDFISSSTSTT